MYLIPHLNLGCTAPVVAAPFVAAPVVAAPFVANYLGQTCLFQMLHHDVIVHHLYIVHCCRAARPQHRRHRGQTHDQGCSVVVGVDAKIIEVKTMLPAKLFVGKHGHVVVGGNEFQHVSTTKESFNGGDPIQIVGGVDGHGQGVPHGWSQDHVAVHPLVD